MILKVLVVIKRALGQLMTLWAKVSGSKQRKQLSSKLDFCPEYNMLQK